LTTSPPLRPTLFPYTTLFRSEDALQRVRDAIDKARNDLPQNLDNGPTAQDVNFSEFPIMNVNMAGNYSLKQLKEFAEDLQDAIEDRKSTRLNSSHVKISYAVF